ncbi:hypothetical protein [Microlunatus parietis]|uniref:DUF4913 domain-containing protein n=1 Tax=Microlunatus parietis TaxID=682979 RepID=A0A7Y9ICM5_9ACTN|nr:hypothetical protein [Microlunatus parietis]NYE74242.1 hypothetical protein [Microlunatus parietis]
MTITIEERVQLLQRGLAGLGREVEATRTAQAGLADRAGLEQLAEEVRKLAEQVAALPDLLTPEPDQVPPVESWLAGLPDTFTPSEVLTDLTQWLRTVYLQYADGAAGLPECWLWHPEVIEELVWLMQAWRASYLGRPSVRSAADWHDRMRPGVVRRISDYAGKCSLDHHQTDQATGRPDVPTATAADAIAAWWEGPHDRPAPVPTDEQLAAADAAFHRRTRTRGGQS